MLIGLEELAHETSSEKRRELLNRVSEMFLDGAAEHSDRESTLYADVVLRVLDELATDDRASFSASISAEAAIPHDVALRLAGDEISVASPVLSRSPVLTDEDLIDVASRASQDHLEAISHRETLSENVTDTLIQRGDARVVRTVSGNEGARFSPSGLTTLAERSAEDETVCANLLRRTDLRAQLVEKVLPKLSTALAEKLYATIASADDGFIARVVDRAEDELANARTSAARQRLETRALINDLMYNGAKVDDAIVMLVSQGRIADVVTVVAKLSGVPENVVSNVMFKTNNEPVAILLRAVGANVAGFKALQEMRAQKLRLPESHLERGMRAFAQLNEQTAKRSLRFVKVRTAVA